MGGGTTNRPQLPTFDGKRVTLAFYFHPLLPSKMNGLKDGREWNGKEGGVLYDVDDDGICTITMNRPE